MAAFVGESKHTEHTHVSLSVQYGMPTDSPDIRNSLLARAMTPLLWAKHRPDRFDSWSAGVQTGRQTRQAG